MFRNRKRRPDRRSPGTPTRLSVDLDPFAVLHHSPVLARALVRTDTER